MARREALPAHQVGKDAAGVVVSGQALAQGSGHSRQYRRLFEKVPGSAIEICVDLGEEIVEEIVGPGILHAVPADVVRVGALREPQDQTRHPPLQV